MKQRKKVFHLMSIWLMIVCVTFSASAAVIDNSVAPLWDNTEMLFTSHDYIEDGEAECVVEIVAKYGATRIDNIDIVYYAEGFSSGWEELARWEDLYVNDDYFFWYDYVPGVQTGREYRLTVSFDVHYNGTVEHIESTHDRLYE